MQVGNQDFELDLLFFHRDLQCLVAFELKTGRFEPEHMGKLAFYLEALDRDRKRPHENPSIGVLLCRTKDDEVAEYAMNSTPIARARHPVRDQDDPESHTATEASRMEPAATQIVSSKSI